MNDTRPVGKLPDGSVAAFCLEGVGLVQQYMVYKDGKRVSCERTGVVYSSLKEAFADIERLNSAAKQA